MNLLLLDGSDRVADGVYRVRDGRARHVREVLRSSPGDVLRVGLLGGGVGSGEVEAVDEGGVTLRCAFGAAPPRPATDLVLAITRPKMLTRLLPQVAALGVDRLVLLRTWRVAKPYLTARVLEPDVYRALLLDGLAQGRGTHLPRVSVEPLFRPFVEDRAPALTTGATALLADPAASSHLGSVPLKRAERVVLAIGPEGGFLPFEAESFARAGFRPVSLGDPTLRTDTATVAALAQISLLRAQSGA